MFNFALADNKIKFVTHTVEWMEREQTRTQACYSAEEKDAHIERLAIRSITPVVTELEQPNAELLASCEGKVFSSYDDAVAFVNGTYVEPLTLESLAEVVADMIGGVL